MVTEPVDVESNVLDATPMVVSVKPEVRLNTLIPVAVVRKETLSFVSGRDAPDQLVA